MSAAGSDGTGTGADAGSASGTSAAATSRLVRLRILDKEVQLACHPDEESELMQAAAYVDRAMRELRQRNTTSSIEKIAIVTAINTASSLLKSRSRASGEGEGEGDATLRIARLNERLEDLLAEDAGKAASAGEAPDSEVPAEE